MSATELVRYEPNPRAREWVELMAPAAELAKVVAGTEFVPRSMRNSPAQVAAAILYGDELGIGPMQSLAKIAVIDGRPSLAAETQRALILAAGHKIWPEELTGTRATWAGRRADDDVTSRITWTMDDARRAGIAGKPNWRSYPRAMLSARASAELARAIFADVIGGLAATEELEADEVPAPPAQGPASGAAAIALDARPNRSSAKRRRRSTPAAAAPTAPAPLAIATVSAPAESGEELPPLPGEEQPPAMSQGQQRRMMALFRERGITDRAERLAFATGAAGRELSSSKELTATEADAVIAALEQPAADEQSPPPDEEPAP